jgi:hypothetical protein
MPFAFCHITSQFQLGGAEDLIKLLILLRDSVVYFFLSAQAY